MLQLITSRRLSVALCCHPFHRGSVIFGRWIGHRYVYRFCTCSTGFMQIDYGSQAQSHERAADIACAKASCSAEGLLVRSPQLKVVKPS